MRSIKVISSIAILSTLTVLTGLPAVPVQAQAAKDFPDVPANHWAYAAVKELADKGLVLGYPNGEFLGQRAMTRYEFATIVDRLLQTVAQMAKPEAPPASSPAPTVTQDDLNKIQVLVDAFRTELVKIQTDVKTAQDNIESLREDVKDAKAIAGKALDTANNSYGFGPNRKFTVGGFVQFRYQAADQDKQARYPHGTPASSTAYNGNYAGGANSGSFMIREARIYFTGAVTPNSKYLVELGVPGASSTVAPGSTQVLVRRAYGQYTFGDGSAKNPNLTFGQFWNPFGFMINSPRPTWYSPERPLAFNEGLQGLFASQEFDRGVKLTIPHNQWTATAALINGTGSASNDVDRVIDQVYRLSYQAPSKVWSAGVSYYNGQLPGTGVGLGSAGPPPVAIYAAGQKQLAGADFQYVSPKGPFLLAEYLAGKYESRTYFGSAVAATATTTNPAPGNKVEGYYAQAGYTANATGLHPFTVAVDYDVFRRSKSGVVALAPGGASGSTFDDVNIGFGMLYNLDKQTRFRLWYEKPDKVAHAASSAEPPKIGLVTGEIQVRF